MYLKKIIALFMSIKASFYRVIRLASCHTGWRSANGLWSSCVCRSKVDLHGPQTPCGRSLNANWRAGGSRENQPVEKGSITSQRKQTLSSTPLKLNMRLYFDKTFVPQDLRESPSYQFLLPIFFCLHLMILLKWNISAKPNRNCNSGWK